MSRSEKTVTLPTDVLQAEFSPPGSEAPLSVTCSRGQSQPIDINGCMLEWPAGSAFPAFGGHEVELGDRPVTMSGVTFTAKPNRAKWRFLWPKERTLTNNTAKKGEWATLLAEEEDPIYMGMEGVPVDARDCEVLKEGDYRMRLVAEIVHLSFDNTELRRQFAGLDLTASEIEKATGKLLDYKNRQNPPTSRLGLSTNKNDSWRVGDGSDACQICKNPVKDHIASSELRLLRCRHCEMSANHNPAVLLAARDRWLALNELKRRCDALGEPDAKVVKYRARLANQAHVDLLSIISLFKQSLPDASVGWDLFTKGVVVHPFEGQREELNLAKRNNTLYLVNHKTLLTIRCTSLQCICVLAKKIDSKREPLAIICQCDRCNTGAYAERRLDRLFDLLGINEGIPSLDESLYFVYCAAAVLNTKGVTYIDHNLRDLTSWVQNAKITS
eukprot:TRINITY_DN32961_c0_g1_i1.p1 TRINITY_DN32961_c0_g1~~TRINITY_DN32961_c0_g1_i1.p1  ORF type:complete len:443 (+),score=61.28 TRINITY_DN32961_c0_g1_i1:554-1882(+)